MSDEKKCAHAACKCPAAADSDHCGDYCLNASHKAEHGDGCGCDHPACKTKPK